MAASRGLGKGLDALIPVGINEKKAKAGNINEENAERKEGEKLVNITKVEPNREQPQIGRAHV